MNKFIIFIIVTILIILGFGAFSFMDTSPNNLPPTNWYGEGVQTSETEFKGNILFTFEEFFTNAYDGLHIKIEGYGFHEEYNDYSSGVCRDDEGDPLWLGFGFDQQFDGEKMLLEIGKGMSPKVCDEVNPSTAETFTHIFIREVGSFTFEVRSNGRVDTYEIDLQDEVIIVSPITSTFTEFESLKVDRVPEGIIYASCNKVIHKWFYPKDEFCLGFYKHIEAIATPYTKSDGSIAEDFYVYHGDDQDIQDVYLKHENKLGYSLEVSTKDGRWASRNNSHNDPLRVSPVFSPYNPRFDPYKKEISPDNIDTSECSDDKCLLEVAYNTQDVAVCRLMSGPRADCFQMIAILTLDDKLCGTTGSNEGFVNLSKRNSEYAECLSTVKWLQNQ
jgi:hypothetical protein